MGTYYKLVNVTKKQWYEPTNGAVKRGAFIWYSEEIVTLLLGDWIGDEVVMVPDDGFDLYDVPEDENWKRVESPIYGIGGKKGEPICTVEKNGMTKLLTEFVEALGAEAVAVALDAAIEKAEK